jgi:dipeptide/tripeptide permease
MKSWQNIDDQRTNITRNTFDQHKRNRVRCDSTLMQGYILLAVQAHVPSLQPSPCSPGQQATCESVHGSNLSLLLLGLYLIPIGDGAARACLPALGGEQFDTSDPVEQRQEASFFNWYTFAVSAGGFIGLVFVVWVENSKGWDIGFVTCAICVFLGMLTCIAGFPFYRNQLPTGSPITRILQVCIAFESSKLIPFCIVPHKWFVEEHIEIWISSLKAISLGEKFIIYHWCAFCKSTIWTLLFLLNNFE